MAFNFSVPVEVRFRDLDALGHVNNAVYFTYLEIARTAYAMRVAELRSIGDLFFMVVRAECDFKQAATYGQRLDVAVRTSRIGNRSFTLDYRITGPDLIAEARTVQACYDFATHQVMAVPERFRKQIEAFEHD